MAIVAGAAMAAAAVIATIALAFAIFAFSRPMVGTANAAAIVAAAFAALIGLAGPGRPGRRLARRRAAGVDEGEAMGLADRLMDLARDKPVVAVGVALALGLVLMRNPKSLGAIARAFFDSLAGVRPPTV